MSTCRVHDCGAATQGFICKACGAELERALAEMQSLRHEVSLLATRQTRVYRANGAGDLDQQRQDAALAVFWEAERRAREASIAPAFRSKADRTALPSTRMMVNLPARDLLADVDNLLVGWARVLHESTGTPWQMDTTEAVIVWLATNAESFRWHEAAAEAHQQILDARRRMQRAVDRAPSKVYAGPCGADLDDSGICPRPLFATAPPRFDNEHERDAWWRDHPIICDGYRPPFDRSDGYDPTDTGCGYEHDRFDRREWMIAELEDRLLAFSVLQDCLPSLLPELTWPTRSTWWRWRKLLPVKTVIDGVEFFRGGDVIALCQREQKRMRGNAAKRRMSA